MHDSMNITAPRGSEASPAVADIEAELRVFEAEERRRLGLDTAPDPWRDPDMIPFTEEQRPHTTILFGGLTVLHDTLIQASLTRLGYRVLALDCPDNDALQYGKEFGNRGQCNPTYFTVGNLLKYLVQLRDEGMDDRDIVNNHVFITAGACGPCRFGTYFTEYRKGLKDAGFDGFRIYDIRKFGQHKHDPTVAGLKLDVPFALAFFRSVLAGDVINAIGYRIRPYEVVPGATNSALKECREILCTALREGRSLLRALRRCRKVIAKVEVDRLKAKPKVAIIGEFWAMTTEGDGNYNLHRFLESEGAECDIQMMTAWLLYEIWEFQFDTRERMSLRRRHHKRYHSETNWPVLSLAGFWLASFLVQRCFYAFARAAGLRDFHLPDMDHLALISRELYPNQLRGGEGHMEVGKVIDAVSRKKVHMVISVKPFGCMPSSGVSDGIQSLVTARYPEANFCPIETSGDGAVGVYSRVQMALFKARRRAKDEYEKALAATGLGDPEEARKAMNGNKRQNALNYPRHVVAGTAANAVYELAPGSEQANV